MIPYEIAVKLSVQNGISSVFAAIAKQALHLEGGIGTLAKQFETLNRASIAAGGGLAALGGAGIWIVLKKITDQAKELSHELVQIQKLGLNPSQFTQARAAIFGMHNQVPGATSLDAAKVYGAMYSTIGHENALKMMKPLSEFAQVMGATTGDYKGAADKVYDMVRAGHEMGKFIDHVTHKLDVEGFLRFLDLGNRTMLATHGKVTAETWFGMSQQGSAALSGLSDEGLYTMAMLAQNMKGQRAGTALMSMYSQLQGGIMTQWRAKLLQDMGFVGDFTVNKGGHLSWAKGALDTPFTRTMGKDPLAGTEMLVEGLKKQGYKDTDSQVKMLFQLFQRQTTIREIHELLRNIEQLKPERERMRGAMGVSAAQSLGNSQDYTQVMHNFDAAWTEMVMHIGLPMTRAAIPLMKEITRAFDAFTDFAKAHPDDIEKIAKGLGMLGAVMIGAGIVALISAIGAGGWLIGGLGALIALNWDTLGTPLKSFVSSMASFAAISWDIFLVGFKGLVGLIQELFSIIGDAGKWLFNKTGYDGGGGGFGPGGMVHNASLGGAAGSISGATGGGGGARRAWTGDAGGMKPFFRTKLDSMLADANASGHPLSVFSGYRSQAHQDRLFANSDHSGHWVARHSHHTMGIAADLRGDLGWAHANAGRYGLHFPMPWERWHVEPMGGARNRGSSGGSSGQTHETHIYLDGKKIASNVANHITRGMTHPTSAPYHDGRRSWTSPDAGLVNI